MNNLQRRYSKGFSLVELLIAMALGLFLITGVIQLFMGSSRTYSVVTAQSQVQDTGRFSLFFLTSSLRHAGFWASIDDPKTFEAHEQFAADNAVIFGRNNDAADALVLDGTDDVYVRMTGSDDGVVKTCLGAAISDVQVAIDHYYVGVLTGSEKIPSLYCSSRIYNLNMATLSINDPAGGPPAELVRSLLNGIEGMQLLYGIGDEAGVTQYVDAATITNWLEVRSVKVALLSASNDDSAGIANNKSYALLDETFVASGDRRPRMVFQKTITLRNFIPEA